MFHHRKPNQDEEHKYWSDYEAINEHKQHGYTSSWGPSEFKKTNHPLAIMVRYWLVCTVTQICV
jgi:hypothetical protein